MKEWLQSYGYLLWVLALVIVVFIVVFYFAVRAYSKHMKTYKAQEAEIKRLTALKEKFRDFDENTIKNTHNDEILEGVALIYQIHLQKKDDMEKEFLLLNAIINLTIFGELLIVCFYIKQIQYFTYNYCNFLNFINVLKQ